MAARIGRTLAGQIVETLKSICDRDINFIDPDGRIIASTDPERVNSYHEGGHEASRTGEIIVIERDDPVRNLRHGINMPIRFHSRTVAVIGITGPPAEVRRYTELAQRLTLLHLREQELEARNYDRRTQTAQLVRALLAGEAVSSGFLGEVLKANGIPMEGGVWRTVVLQLQTRHGRPLAALEAEVNALIDRAGRCLSAFFFPDEYIVILPAEVFEAQEAAFAALAEAYPDAIKIGVGSRRHLTRQDLSAEAARLALRSLEPGQNYALYERMRLELLLAGVGEGARRAYLARCLAALTEEEKSLLRLYFSQDASLKDTAAALFMHKNTLQYRLRRIQERSGLDPRRFREAAAIYAALVLERIGGAE
ncbi:MAG: CdaR family transcriptional regulator [bacterium]